MTKTSTMKAFAPGDIFLGCTYLCHPDDDHAGEGRILQFSRELVPKGTLYTRSTTHLVVNLRFGPDGSLWVGHTERVGKWLGGNGMSHITFTGRVPM